MNLLHTSDWHLGRALYGRKRYEEFAAFLDWLADTIERERIDVLLVAGDVFDTGTPSNRAQQLYYRFLCRMADTACPCRHVVVVAGNHDSPSFLDAPRELLKALDVHVIGSRTEDPEDEVLVLRDRAGRPELIVCAVPYLRDRDIRTAEAGESMEDKERKLTEGIRDHYAAVAALAEEKRSRLGGDPPIVAMGHLFAAGGQIIGSLARVAAGVFPASFDYLALGHLHVPQLVDHSATRRYSGSPLAMGFGEAGQAKSVCRVRFAAGQVTAEPVEVPVFQQLERIRGDLAWILDRLQTLAAAGSRAWLEIEYTGDEVVGDLRDRLDQAIAGTTMEILRIRNNRLVDSVLGRMHAEETLDDLDVEQVFLRRLARETLPEEQQQELLATYRETLSSLHDDDLRAE
jgi:exonuclease SbcD